MAAQRAVIVGAGFGGMAAAIRLRAKGYDVLLLDRCDALGGRAQVFCRGGYRHDAGPTVITASFLFRELFALHGRQLEEYVQLVDLNPWYRFRFPDGTYFNYGGSVADTLEEIRRISPEDAEGYLALVEESKRIFAVGFEQLADASFARVGAMIAQVPALIRLKSHRSVWQMVCRHIRHPWLRRAFSVSPLLVGGNPFDTTSIYSLIHFLERKWGIQFAMGGAGALVSALDTLMSEIGVEVRLNTTVEEVVVQHGRATGVRMSDGRVHAADLVVSNADPSWLYTKMISNPPIVPRLKTRTAKSSMGLFVLYFGTTRRYDDVAHHTIWFGERYKELLRDIFDCKPLSEDFSLYVHRPTATDMSFAPPGCDSWYVLAPVPNLRSGTKWDEVAESYGDSILEALEESMMPNLRAHVVERFHMTPLDFRDRYLSVHGAGFSIAPILRQSAWFRFHNRAEGIENLYLVGAGTHPGAGLPGVLCSAKVLDRLLPQVTCEDTEMPHGNPNAGYEEDAPLEVLR
jgi:phytoene desaturase